MPTPAVISSSLLKATHPLLELGGDAARAVSPSTEAGEAFGHVLHGLTTGEPIGVSAVAVRGEAPVTVAAALASETVSGETVPSAIVPGETVRGGTVSEHETSHSIMRQSVLTPPGTHAINEIESTRAASAPRADRASIEFRGIEKARAGVEVPFAKNSAVASSAPLVVGLPVTHPVTVEQGFPVLPRAATTESISGVDPTRPIPLPDSSLITAVADDVVSNTDRKTFSVIASSADDVSNAAAAKNAPLGEGIHLAESARELPSNPLVQSAPPALSAPPAQGVPVTPRDIAPEPVSLQSARSSEFPEISLMTVVAGTVLPKDVPKSSSASAPAAVEALNTGAVKSAPPAQGVPVAPRDIAPEPVSLQSGRFSLLPEASLVMLTTETVAATDAFKSSVVFTPAVASALGAVAVPGASVAQAKPVQVGQEPPRSEGIQERGREPIRAPVTAPTGLAVVLESVRQSSPRQVLGALSQPPVQPAPVQPAPVQLSPVQLSQVPYPPMTQAREPVVFEAMRYEALRRNSGTKEQIGRPLPPDFTPMAAMSVAPSASPVVAGATLQSAPAPVAHVPSNAEINLFSEGWETNLAELVDRISSTSQGGGDSLTVVRLSPDHLGDLEIGVTMKDGEVDVSFAASVAETRAALEQALPKLRDLLGQSGLELSSASVYSNLPSGSERRQGSLADALPVTVGSEDRAQSDDEPQQDGDKPTRDERGGVDLYV